jgi:thiol-disulfide isomerase/thioredoxin
MKRTLPILFVLFGFMARSQGYEIKINIKGFTDSVAYLAKHNFGKQYVVDTCKTAWKGNITFKGKKDLDKGMYFLASEGKEKNAIHRFDFIVDDSQKFSITTDMKDLQYNLKAEGSKENEEFFNYTRFFIDKNKSFGELIPKTKGMNKADSTKFMLEKAKQFTDEVLKFEADFMKKQQGTFLWTWLNLRTEKELKTYPAGLKTANDSTIARFNYYKGHYWDGVDFKDGRVMRTQFFDKRLNKYFDQIVNQLGPDTVANEIDKILSQCEPGSEMFNFLFVHFMVEYENPKLVGFDKVFVMLVDKYIRTKKSGNLYDEKTIAKIIEKADIIKPLLIGSVAPDLFMIDTIGGKVVNKMGFDTAKTSETVTKLYYKNMDKLAPLYKTLSSVQAKYLILVFWDVDCSHCQTEIPKLLQIYHELRKSYDVKVFSVYTVDEFDKWRKYIIDKKLDWINVYDPVHINNIKTKYDIFSTPKVYLLDKDKIIKSKHMPVDKITELIKAYEDEEKANPPAERAGKPK